MIKLDGISFAYGQKTVIDRFSVSIDKGDRICFFGESGSGKTTLLKLICGLLNPTEGKIYGNYDHKFSAVFQEDRLLPFKSVLQNVMLTGCEKCNAMELLKKTGLSDVYNKKCIFLSGGMNRRVALARALASDFDILMLDEPFTGLDSENVKRCAELINDEVGERTVLLVTHDLSQADLIGCRIIKI